MNPSSVPDREALQRVPEHERRGNFHYQPLWRRAIIVAAGPLTNLVIALAIFAAFNLAYGRIEAPAVVDRFAEQSVARDAGVRVGDRIVAIDGDKVESFMDIADRVLMYPGRRIALEIDRGGETLMIPVRIGSTVESDGFGNESRVGRIGIYAVEPQIVPVGPLEAVTLSFKQSADLMRMMATGIGQIFTGDRSVKELGGPLKIAKFSGEQLSLGPQAFVGFVALISINLAFINLLPIPALDGGHLAFYAAEAVRRKPLGQRSQEWAFRTGIGLVLALMLFVTINDIASLPLFGG